MVRRVVRGVRVRPFHQRYLSYQIGDERQKIPFLQIRLIGAKQTVRTTALVDSGATVTFIQPDLADALDLEVVERDVSAVGAGGEFLNDIRRFDLEILKGQEVVHRISGKAHVPKDSGKIPYVVLGRDYIFETYDITFQEIREMVGFKPARGR